MLGRHYIQINGVDIPNPEVSGIAYANTENIKKSETAEDIGNPVRLAQRTFNFTFQSTSRGRDKIVAFCKLNSVVLTFDGEPITGRIRIKSGNMLKGSELTARTQGLWTLTVSFMER